MQQIEFTCQKKTVVGQTVVLLGSIPELGDWKEFKAEMTWSEGHNWRYTLKIKKCESFKYKYALIEKKGT